MCRVLFECNKRVISAKILNRAFINHKHLSDTGFAQTSSVERRRESKTHFFLLLVNIIKDVLVWHNKAVEQEHILVLIADVTVNN